MRCDQWFNCPVGQDAAFIGPNENQFAILEDDRTGLAVYTLPGGPAQEVKEPDNVFAENQPAETSIGSFKGPTSFMFEAEIDRIFSTPLGTWSCYMCFFRPLYMLIYSIL